MRIKTHLLEEVCNNSLKLLDLFFGITLAFLGAMKRIVPLFCVLLLLAACKGGGGGGTHELPPVDPPIIEPLTPSLDADGIPDEEDNCPKTDNVDQLNTDGDAEGDACDADDDADGILDLNDNCTRTPNVDQEDLDGDGIGDFCAEDIDGDGFLNAEDNCPRAWNVVQMDLDGDGLGDFCDVDIDNDGLANETDNCPSSLGGDISQLDLDRDRIGDLCDSDLDGDRVLNIRDNCMRVMNTNQLDYDTDLLGDLCDDDDDGDGYSDAVEVAAGRAGHVFDPLDAASHPTDLDSDGVFDHVDPDADGDGRNRGDLDCNDFDRAIYAGAADELDKLDLDNNCDGIDGDLRKGLSVSPGGRDIASCGDFGYTPCHTINYALGRIQALATRGEVRTKLFLMSNAGATATFSEQVILDSLFQIIGGYCAPQEIGNGYFKRLRTCTTEIVHATDTLVVRSGAKVSVDRVVIKSNEPNPDTFEKAVYVKGNSIIILQDVFVETTEAGNTDSVGIYVTGSSIEMYGGSIRAGISEVGSKHVYGIQGRRMQGFSVIREVAIVSGNAIWTGLGTSCLNLEGNNVATINISGVQCTAGSETNIASAEGVKAVSFSEVKIVGSDISALSDRNGSIGIHFENPSGTLILDSNVLSITKGKQTQDILPEMIGVFVPLVGGVGGADVVKMYRNTINVQDEDAFVAGAMLWGVREVEIGAGRVIMGESDADVVESSGEDGEIHPLGSNIFTLQSPRVAIGISLIGTAQTRSLTILGNDFEVRGDSSTAVGISVGQIGNPAVSSIPVRMEDNKIGVIGNKLAKGIEAIKAAAVRARLNLNANENRIVLLGNRAEEMAGIDWKDNARTSFVSARGNMILLGAASRKINGFSIKGAEATLYNNIVFGGEPLSDVALTSGFFLDKTVPHLWNNTVFLEQSMIGSPEVPMVGVYILKNLSAMEGEIYNNYFSILRTRAMTPSFGIGVQVENIGVAGAETIQYRNNYFARGEYEGGDSRGSYLAPFIFKRTSPDGTSEIQAVGNFNLDEQLDAEGNLEGPLSIHLEASGMAMSVQFEERHPIEVVSVVDAAVVLSDPIGADYFMASRGDHPDIGAVEYSNQLGVDLMDYFSAIWPF